MPDSFSSAREAILQKMRSALREKTPEPCPGHSAEDFYMQSGQPPDALFAERLEKVSGRVELFPSEAAVFPALRKLMADRGWNALCCRDPILIQKLTGENITVRDDLSDEKGEVASLTGCEFLIARTGSVLVSSAQVPGRLPVCLPAAHIILAYTSQLVLTLKAAMEKISLKYKERLPSMLSLITGPSRTADIEKTLVLGAHGPKELYVYLAEG